VPLREDTRYDQLHRSLLRVFLRRQQPFDLTLPVHHAELVRMANDGEGFERFP
jgi:hypothetical protein